MLRLFQVGAGQVGQGRGGRAACGPGVDLRARLRRSEGRVHPKKTVHGPQELLGEEVYVFEEADEDTVLGIECAPGIQRAQVIRPPSGTFTAEYPEELLLRYGVYCFLLAPIEAHHGLRPDALHRVAHHENNPRVRDQAVNPADDVRSERGVGRCDLTDHPSSARLEERSVPSVTRGTQVVSQIPREVLPGEPPQVLSRPAPDLPAPTAVGAACAKDPAD